MRIIILILLIALLVWCIVYPIVKLRLKPSGVLVGGLAIIIVITAGFEARWLYVEYKATELVKEVSQRKDGFAECQRFSKAFIDAEVGTLGFVAYAEDNKALIKYNQCQHWADFLFSDKTNANEKQLLSVGTVIHEGFHVGGEFNEATTQCLTIKHYPEFLEKLGTPKNKIAVYSEQYAEMSKRMPSEYLNGVC